MGKTLIQQARGRGGPVYRVRKKAYLYKISYPPLKMNGKAKIVRLLNSSAHSAPLAKISIGNYNFYSPAAYGIYEGQEIDIDSDKIKEGNITKLKNIPVGTKIFNIELFPGGGGKIVRSSGCFATVYSKNKGKVEILIKRRKIELDENCRATIGVIAGSGRKMKPLVKAGKKYYIMKSKGRKWHRTSAVKMNAVDHPFGGGRGKRIKSKIAKRNAPPGAKVGHIRPRKTGKNK